MSTMTPGQVRDALYLHIGLLMHGYARYQGVEPKVFLTELRAVADVGLAANQILEAADAIIQEATR